MDFEDLNKKVNNFAEIFFPFFNNQVSSCEQIVNVAFKKT